MNQTKIYGHQKAKSPISASFSADAFGVASSIGTAVIDELISQNAGLRNRTAERDARRD